MRNFLRSAIAVGALTIAACASNPTGPGNVDVKPVAGMKAGVTTYAPKFIPTFDRAPANEPAEYTWKPQTVSFNVRSGTVNYNTAVDVNLEKSWVTEYSCPQAQYSSEWRFGPTTCSTLVCSTSGDGKSALWNAFYSAKKADKAAALAEAIKGVGPVSANALIANGYFQKKPRTWDDFHAEIYRAREAGVINNKVARDVTYDYRAENAESLGYASCVDRSYACQDFYYFDGWETIDKTCRQPHSAITDTRHFNVNIQVVDAKLMTSELEAVSFDINERGQITQNSAAGQYNRYAASSTVTQDGQVTVVLKAEQRFLKNISQTTIRQQTWTFIGGVPTFVLDVDPAMIAGADDPNSKLVLDYTIKYCKPGLFGCATFGGEEKVLKQASLPITEARTIMNNFDGAGLKGKNVWIDYTVSRQNSQFFKSTPTSKYNTDRIKF